MTPSRLSPAPALLLTLALLPVLVSPDTPPLQCAYPCSLPTPPSGGSAGYSPPVYPGGGSGGGTGANNYPPPYPGSGSSSGGGGGTGGNIPYFPSPVYPGGQGQGQVPQQPPNKIMPYFPYYFRNAAAPFQGRAGGLGAVSSAAVLLLLQLLVLGDPQ